MAVDLILDDEPEFQEMPSLEATLPITESPGLSPIFPVKPAKKQRLITPMLSTPLQSSKLSSFSSLNE